MPSPDTDNDGAFAFELDSGSVCLDFANTLSRTTGEHLSAYADLLAFAQQAHLLTPSEVAELQARASRRPVEAAGVLTRARRLRSTLYRVFSRLAQGKRVAQADLDALNFDLAASLPHARVGRTAGDGYAWYWLGRGSALDCMLWPITRSAAELLVSDADRPRLRECRGTECQWLFLDTTRNRSRQWCSMQTCGNRQKARRHYQRVRAHRVPVGSGEPAPGRRQARRSVATPAAGASATAE